MDWNVGDSSSITLCYFVDTYLARAPNKHTMSNFGYSARLKRNTYIINNV